VGHPRCDEGATAVTVLGVTNPPALLLAGVWQSAVRAGQQPVLGSCVVAPGFDFADSTLE
jgi:predicted cupin superfamily sugar epimerase